MKKSILIKLQMLLSGSLMFFALCANAQHYCEFNDSIQIQDSNILVAVGACNLSSNYTPNEQYLDNYPIVYVRVDNHVFQRDDGSGNFENTVADINHLQTVIDSVNYLFSHLKMPIPSGNLVTDSRIQFVMGNTHFYQNSTVGVGMTSKDGWVKEDSALAIVHANPNMTFDEKFNTLHIFHGVPDTSIGQGFGGAARGLGNKNYLFVNGYYGNYKADSYDGTLDYSVQAHAGHLAHEIGHSLGLPHTFGQYLCSDYSRTRSTTNNFMDYMEGPIVYDEESLTVCQIGKIHHYLKGLGPSSYNIDDCVIDTYCTVGSSEDVIIEAGEIDIWENARFLNGNLVIKNGGVLRIKCYTSIPSDGKIVVEKGGKLVLDGGIISNECGSQWQGIFVEGDPNKTQLPLSNQGFVHIINGGTIEHARTAVTLCGVDANGNQDISKSGGILIANTAIFRDNWRDVSFTGYAKQASTGSFANANISSFTECYFFTTNDYRSDHVGDIWPNVTMWGVVQVRFLGCTFHDQRDGINSLDPRIDDYLNRRDGLFTMDASYRMMDKNFFNPLEYSPPSSPTATRFIDMRYGIQSLDNPLTGNNFTAGRPSTVQDVQFESCLGGIYHSGVEGAIMSRNNFEIESYAVSTFRDIEAYGIYLDNSNGYKAEGNRFSSDWMSDPNNNLSAAFVTNANEDNNNEIYRNFFDNNLLGTQAIGWNRHHDVGQFPEIGLKYRCNSFGFDINDSPSDNNLDMWATHHQTIPYTTAQTGLPQQGSGLDAMGNLFGDYGAFGNRHFDYLQNPNSFVQYFHHDPANEPRVEPIVHYGVNPFNTQISYTGVSNECPDNTASGTAVPYSNIDKVNTHLSVKKMKRQELVQLVDGGNPGLVVQRVQQVHPGTVTALVADLWSYTPYLSNEVLLALSSSVGVFSQTAIKDLLVANPHSARNPLVMATLVSRTDSFPASYILDIEAVETIFTARDDLMNEVYHHSNEFDFGVNSILVRALNNDQEDQFEQVIEPLLIASDVPQHKYRLAALYDSRNEASKAQTVLEGIPSLELFDDSRLSYHNDLMALRTLLATWRESNVDISNLDATQLAMLQSYESKINGIQYKVYPLLALNNACTYIAPIYMPTTAPVVPNSANSVTRHDNKQESNDSGQEKYGIDITRLYKSSQINVYPNPTQKLLNVAYQIENNTEDAVITINNMEGKVLISSELTKNEGVEQIDVSAMRNGQYICTITSNGKTLKQIKFAITR